MKRSVYIETTIISYLTARRTRDELRNGQIGLTRQWWTDAAERFDLRVSALVIAEASAGDAGAAAERLQAIAGLSVLDITPEAESLARSLLLGTALPAKANRDALHVAIAATNGLDFLLTWNCRHLANATLRRRIESVCSDHGYNPPLICTPQELQEVA